MSNQSADAVFDALGEPVRRRILELLRDGPTPVGRLAERLPVGRPDRAPQRRHQEPVRAGPGRDGHRAAVAGPDLGYRPGRLRRRGEEETAMNTLPPIRRAILVEADPAAAFEVFTAGLGRWWPLGELSVHGKDATVSFDGAEAGARIVERSAGGETAVW